MNTLKNHLLISVPHMNDTFFGKSVVYICDHNKEGAMGLIINKPINHREVEEIIKIENLQGNQLEIVKIKTFFGGPVLTEKMIVLHTNTLKTDLNKIQAGEGEAAYPANQGEHRTGTKSTMS